MSHNELPIPQFVYFIYPDDGNCNDFNDPSLKQYINLEKTGGSYLCDGKSILTEPENYDNWFIAAVQVIPPLPNIPVQWHSVDPWHRVCFSGNGHNEYNCQNLPSNQVDTPLWDFWRYHHGGRFFEEEHSHIQCGDEDFWDVVHDNFTIDDFMDGWGTPYLDRPLDMDNRDDWAIIMEDYRAGRLGYFSPLCETFGINVGGSSLVSGLCSFTDCNGEAEAIFTTSSFGGDNHILVAQACPGWQTGQVRCVEPAVSETIEIWRKAEVYQVVLNENTQNQLYLCDDPTYPLAFSGPFQNRFDIVDTAFMDCFVEVEHNDFDLKESVDFVLQVGKNVSHRDERSSGNHLYQMDVCNVGPGNPLYRYLLLCCDYYCGTEVFICDECMPNGDEWEDNPEIIHPYDMCIQSCNDGKTSTGISCGSYDCCRIAKHFMGIIEDLRIVSEFANTSPPHQIWDAYIHSEAFDEDNETMEIKTTCHELGHVIGDLNKGTDGVDVDRENPAIRQNLEPRFEVNGIYYGKSIMFYEWDAEYFNPIHIYWIRTEIKGFYAT